MNKTLEQMKEKNRMFLNKDINVYIQCSFLFISEKNVRPKNVEKRFYSSFDIFI